MQSWFFEGAGATDQSGCCRFKTLRVAESAAKRLSLGSTLPVQLGGRYMPDPVNCPQNASNPLVSSAVRQILNRAMLGGAVASTWGVGTAQAQQGPAASPAAGPELQEVIVTGSRIRRVDAETANPVLVIDQQTIQESGITQVGDLLQRIPSISGNATNPNVNNGGGFAESTVELRGLDAKRTLILVDGHRVGFVGTTADATDVNQIPFNMIDHVEVLKEGAGAIYGSDAIGGVVNFITRKNYEGVELTGDLGETTHADGKHGQFGILFGSTSDKGGIEVGGNYFRRRSSRAGAIIRSTPCICTARAPA
jgi:outer membrane cobalamin receptor